MLSASESKLTVACVWVKGNVPFSLQYVVTLRRMVARHLSIPHRFVCLTDRRTRIPGIETIHVESPKRMFGWWSKIELWKPGRFEGRVIYLDLDTLVVDSLDPILTFPSRLALIPDAGNFNSRTHKLVKRFNSSVMVWNAGAGDVLYERWNHEVTKRLHGDQDWIGEQLPWADKMPIEWFPRLSSCLEGPPPEGAKVILAKVPKNVDAAHRYGWFRKLWV